MTIQPGLQRDVDLREQNQRLKEGLEAATLDLQNAQTDLVAKNREISRLKTELEKLWNRHVPTKELEEVFQHWLVAMGKNPKRTKLTKDRVKLIREGVKSWGVDGCKQAIDGLASRPWVGNRGRSAERYPGATKRDDIEYALSTAKRFEACLEYAEAPEDPKPESHLSLVRGGQVVKADPWSRPLDRAVAAIRREFGVDAAYPSYRSEEQGSPGYWDVEWWCVCPIKPGQGFPMRLREFGWKFGGRIEAVCAHGGECLPSRLLAEIRKFEWRRLNGEICDPPDELLERWAQRERDLEAAA